MGGNVGWSRLETRAAILDYLWRSGGSFRPQLISHVGLTDASVSRILNELRSEGLVVEARRRAPYRGGPSVFLALSDARHVGAIELSNGVVHAGLGSLAGRVVFSAARPLADGASLAATQQAIDEAIAQLRLWSRDLAQPLAQVAISVPGYRPERSANPIVSFDRDRALERIEAELPGTPVAVANSIVARTLSHRISVAPVPAEEPYLYLFIGHGVGAAFVDEHGEGEGLTIYELGHNVIARDGPRCRCGHRGCIEAYVSTGALAELLGVAEAEILAGRMPAIATVAPSVLAEIEHRLVELGMVMGNALNLHRVHRIIVAGWPEWLGRRAKDGLMAGLDLSLFAGAEAVSLSFSPMKLGQEPSSGLALACFSFIRRGARAPAGQNRRAATSGAIA